jgi:ribosomal protein S19E (S16A)
MGKGDEEAKNAAMSGLALYFKSTVSVQQQMLDRYNEVVSGSQKKTEKETAMSNQVQIASQAEFLGAHFTAPWYNEQNRNWYVLAYINKQEAVELYQNRIATNLTMLEAMLTETKEPLQQYQAFKRAASIAQYIEADILGLGELSDAATEHRETLEYTRNVMADSRNFRSQLRFSAAIEADRQGRIQRKLLDVLEKNGYVTVRNQGDYTITGEIFCDEETLPAGFFIHSGISLQLSNGDGKLLFSYTKNYDRQGSRNQEMAYNIAFREMEKDLEANFITEFNAFLGD